MLYNDWNLYFKNPALLVAKHIYGIFAITMNKYVYISLNKDPRSISHLQISFTAVSSVAKLIHDVQEFGKIHHGSFMRRSPCIVSFFNVIVIKQKPPGW